MNAQERENAIAKMIGVEPKQVKPDEPAAPTTGIVRMVSKKQNGYWLARHNGEEKAFYDGCLGSEASAKQAAQKWVDMRKYGKKRTDEVSNADVLMQWLDQQNWETAEQAKEDIRDKIVDLFFSAR